MSCPTLVKSAVISALAGFCLVSSAQDHELTTDVVVIGGGISGLSSAMSVLDHGGKVAVLEKTSRPRRCWKLLRRCFRSRFGLQTQKRT